MGSGDDAGVEARCPACREPGLELRSIRKDIPHFGETVQTVALCGACGFQHADFLVVEESEPVRYRFPYRGEEDLSVRVVRSHTCTVRVPELGLTVEPGARSEGFVSNVEGLLDRLRDAFQWADAVADEEDQEREARDRLEELDRAIAGERELTVVLEDPRGNSAIVDDRAEREVLSEEEAAELETGEIVLEPEDLQPEDADGA